MHIWYPLLFLELTVIVRDGQIQEQGLALDAGGELFRFDRVGLSNAEAFV